LNNAVPKKGDIGFLDFNPQSGVEQAGHRPCIILSPESFNYATGLAIVCPIRTRSGDWPFEVALPPGLNITGYILTDQLRSVNWRARNFNKRDEAPEEVLESCMDLIHTFLP
jgi:mRNA interferase MazF